MPLPSPDRFAPHAAQIPDTRTCWAHHLGLWAIDPLWLQQAVALIRAGLYPVQALADPIPDYDVTPDGVGIIPIVGPLSKGLSKFGGTSSVLARRALRLAAHDPDVGAILLHIDSPGGHVAGIEALAREVSRIDTQIKPVVAHIDDLGASAAYWVASQARRISANATAEIGSIGTVAVIEDSSGRMDRLGIRVHVIASGPYKGAGVDGAPVSEQTLAYVSERVNNLNQHFVTAVQRGRGLSPAALAAATDGRVWIAQRAQQLGLIDAIQDLDTTLAGLSTPPARQSTRRPTAAQVNHLNALLARREEMVDASHGKTRRDKE